MPSNIEGEKTLRIRLNSNPDPSLPTLIRTIVSSTKIQDTSPFGTIKEASRVAKLNKEGLT